MKKFNYEIDVNEVFKRMMSAGDVKYISQLAEDLGLSAQALNQSKARGSISLSLLLKASEKYGASLDYLVRGGVDDLADARKSLYREITGDYDYIELVPFNMDEKVYKRGDRQQPARFNRKWLEFFVYRKSDLTALRSYFVNDKLYIIDPSDRALDDGVFVFNHRSQPIIHECRRDSDGNWRLDGLGPQTEESICRLHIIGRVVWQGMAM